MTNKQNEEFALGCILVIVILISLIAWLANHWISFVVVLAAAILGYVIYYHTFGKKRTIEKARKQEEARRKTLAFERSQKARGLVEYNGRWGTPAQVKKWKRIDLGLDNNFADLSPYQFEEFIAQLFQQMGYSVMRTPGSGDFGADVIAKKKDQTVLIECKKYSEGNSVTPKEVQRALGAMWAHEADKAVFVTTSDFSIKAKQLEQGSPIELWNKTTLHQMVRRYFIDRGSRLSTREARLGRSKTESTAGYVWLENTKKYQCEHCLYFGKYHYNKTLHGMKRHITNKHEQQ